MAPSRGQLAVFVEGKIGPLAGGQGVRAVHWSGSFAGFGVGVVLNEDPWRDRRWGRARLHVELLPVSSSAFGPRGYL